MRNISLNRWLREEKGIAINIIAHDGGQYHWREIFLPNFKGKGYDWYNYHEHPLEETYETALGKGIEWAVNELIASGWQIH